MGFVCAMHLANMHRRSDVPDWVKNDLETQKRTWDLIAKELEAIQPGSVSKLLQVA